MAKHLVIVESPAKAKTIEKYLGKDYTVLSSVGHIRSIVKKTKDGTPPIDVTNGFATQYQVDSDKRKVVTELKKAAKAADTVYLATDPDREGEAIAWHLCEVPRDLAGSGRGSPGQCPHGRYEPGAGPASPPNSGPAGRV